MSEKVLLVDDDEAIRDSLKWLLESAGYEVSCFNSARHFLDSIVEGRPACVVVDIDMPTMTGIEFVPLFRRRYLDVPVVFLTDDIEGRLARRAAVLEPAGLFAKPLDTDRLLSQIREVGG